jgi:hypothetical protein
MSAMSWSSSWTAHTYRTESGEGHNNTELGSGGARIAMTATTNRRRDNRIPMPLEVHFSFSRVEGFGKLADISYSGALIEDTAMRPKIGTPIVLYVYLKPPSAVEAATPFELSGHVVRHSSTGFAVEYEDNLNRDVRRMVDDAAAIVAVPR